MGNRSKLETLKKRPRRLTDWMAESGLLSPESGAETKAKKG